MSMTELEMMKKVETCLVWYHDTNLDQETKGLSADELIEAVRVRVKALEAAEGETEPAKPDPQPTMSMTELERSKRTRECMRWMIGAAAQLGASGLEPREGFDYWASRVAELEAAEKEPEADPLDYIIQLAAERDQHVKRLCERVALSETLIDILRRDLKTHAHCNGDSGKCYYP